MADGSEGPDVSPPAVAAAAGGGEIWGTLEELLLACAVSRHGTGSWDSVAMEVQTRSPLAARPGLTPTSCRLRFRQLHRRFSVGGDGGAAAEEEEENEADGPDASAADGWMDELRRLRVAELRREVERCDLSIGTLQTKVKRLRVERERSIHGDGESKPEAGNGDERLSSEEPSRSCRESNSTDLKPPTRPGDHSVKAEEDEATAAKQEASGESMAASKESSDLRSSASLCRRRRKPGATDEEANGEAASAPRRPPAQPSQPLAALLDTFAARFSPLLERLHESQESDAYRGTIRRHVDIEMVRRRLDASAAGSCGAAAGRYYPAAEFCRDLLLLCTNALVFFPNAGPEHGAAEEARALVNASLLPREPKQEPGAAAAADAGPPMADEWRRVDSGSSGGGADIVGSLIEKGGKPLIVCRKRSSIAKAAAAARKEERAEKTEAGEEGEGSHDGEKKVAVAATKDKAWGSRTKKGRGGGGAHSRKLYKLSEATDAATEGGKKADKKGAADVAAGGRPAKKRNAVDFLKRLNQGSSPSKKMKKKNGSPMGTRKRAAAAAATTTPEQPQKTRKLPGSKEAGRGGAKTATPKRGVGRPPSKRGAAAPTTPPPSKRAKVNRSENTSSTKRGGRR